jgi:hypothetical protein
MGKLSTPSAPGKTAGRHKSPAVALKTKKAAPRAGRLLSKGSRAETVSVDHCFSPCARVGCFSECRYFNRRHHNFFYFVLRMTGLKDARTFEKHVVI